MCCRIEQMSKYTGDSGSWFLLVEKRVSNMEKRKTKMNLILDLEVSEWVHGYVCVCVCTYIEINWDVNIYLYLLAPSAKKLRSRHLLALWAHLTPISWFLNTLPFSTKRNQGSLEIFLVSGLREGKYEMSLEYYVVPESKDVLKR